MSWCKCSYGACHDANVRLGVCHDANVPLVHAMMQISPWCMLWCECPHGACHDANVRSVVCHDATVPLVHAMMRMPLEGMSWCKCLPKSMPWCERPLIGMQWMQMPSCGYIMTQMLWCKHKFFENSLYFQNEASLAPGIKIFSKLDLLFLKSHLLFDLRLPKNWWSLLEISEWDIDLESDDLDQKIYFHNLVKQKG